VGQRALRVDREDTSIMDDQRRDDHPRPAGPYEAPSAVEIEAPMGTTETAPGGPLASA
jgi:hypothetical protein